VYRNRQSLCIIGSFLRRRRKTTRLRMDRIVPGGVYIERDGLEDRFCMLIDVKIVCTRCGKKQTFNGNDCTDVNME
jgi:hypothetical protein